VSSFYSTHSQLTRHRENDGWSRSRLADTKSDPTSAVWPSQIRSAHVSCRRDSPNGCPKDTRTVAAANQSAQFLQQAVVSSWPLGEQCIWTMLVTGVVDSTSAGGMDGWMEGRNEDHLLHTAASQRLAIAYAPPHPTVRTFLCMLHCRRFNSAH